MKERYSVDVVEGPGGNSTTYCDVDAGEASHRVAANLDRVGVGGYIRVRRVADLDPRTLALLQGRR